MFTVHPTGLITGPHHPLTPHYHRPGSRPYVRVRTPTGLRHVEVGRLVLEAFGPPEPPNSAVHYLNGDTSDCRIENLAWISRTLPDPHDHRTTSRPSAKLTPEQVAEVRSYHGSITALAKRLGCTRANIYAILKGDTWRTL